MLLYCFADRNTPVKTKIIIFLALGYFFSPLDVIPDVVPLVGMADDIGVLAYSRAAAKMYISSRHREHAYETLKKAFGENFAKKSNLLSL